jgi:uncharacterized membrane protein
MRLLNYGLIMCSLLLAAAIFGFFYAWVCSTMWGLDQADPRVAIQAMQAMNGSVRNGVFAPAFFGAPLAAFLTAVVLFTQHFRGSAVMFALSGLVSLCLGVVLTMVVHVPMNEALAVVETPTDLDAARAIWQNYSPDWQFWNQTRTVTTGIAFVLAVLGALRFASAGVRL